MLPAGPAQLLSQASRADYAAMVVAAQIVATIETADTPHALVVFATGDTANWTFVDGVTAAITGYADYSGTVADAILATTGAAHNLTTGDWITIRGTAAPNDYNGVRQVTVVSPTTFYFVENGLWNADAGASDLERGDYLTPDAGAEGPYHLSWHICGSEGGAAGSVFHYHIYRGGVSVGTLGAERKFANNDVGAVSGGGLVVIAASDRIWMTLESDGANDLTVEHANLSLHRI